MISQAYGCQTVVVSVDPKKVYVDDPNDTSRHTIKTKFPRDKGQQYCWYRCYTKGVVKLVMLTYVILFQRLRQWEPEKSCSTVSTRTVRIAAPNFELVNDVKRHVNIPVIASSGAGNPSHSKNVFCKTSTDAALGAGMASKPYLLNRNAVLKETLVPSSGIHCWTSQAILGEGRVTDTTFRTRPSKSFMSR